jgi:hypothetical protein
MSGAEQEQFDPEVDLLQRYEQMIQTQIETLNEIDNRALKLSRLIGALVAIGVSAASLIASRGVSIQTNSLLLLLYSAVGLVSMLVSLVFAAITYLSSAFEYGPSHELGTAMSKNNILKQDYKNKLLSGYSRAIKNNKQVVITNARRFQRSLAWFLVGTIFIATGVVVLIGTPSLIVSVAAGVVTPSSAGVLYHYVTEEEYLTIERQ